MIARPLDTLLPEFAGAVDEYVASLIAEADLPRSLDGMLRYHLGWVDERFEPARSAGGKRIRPALVFLACEGAGAPWRTALPVAAAVELAHNFSLVHDDIQDRSPLRRHRPTLWSLWGDSLALNAGDSLFALAQLAAAGQPTGTDQAGLPARHLNQACLQLCAGQHLDLELVGAATPSLTDYYAMIANKTAALLAVAAELGALAAGAPVGARDAYARYGREVGLAFQLQDDLLDVWGATVSRGKAGREDLRYRKHSLPMVLACQLADPPRRNRLLALHGQTAPLPDATVEALVELLDELGVEADATRRVRAHYDAALEALAEADPRPAAGTLLAELAQGLLAREA